MSLRQLNCPEPFTLGSNVSWGSINANDLNLKTLTVNGQAISGGSGVGSINNQQGIVTIQSNDNTVTVTSGNSIIDLSSPGVLSVNGSTDIINMDSIDGSILITSNPISNYIDVSSTLTFTGAGSVNVVKANNAYTINGAVAPVTNITGSGVAIVTQPTAGVFNVAVAPAKAFGNFTIITSSIGTVATKIASVTITASANTYVIINANFSVTSQIDNNTITYYLRCDNVDFGGSSYVYIPGGTRGSGSISSSYAVSTSGTYEFELYANSEVIATSQILESVSINAIYNLIP